MAAGPDSWHLRRRLIRRTKYCSLLLAMFLFLCATPPGLWLFAKSASALVSALTPFTLQVSGVSGILPLTLRISRLELLDGYGTWLTLDDVALRVRLDALFRGHLCLKYITSREVQWERPGIRERRWRIPQIPGLNHYPDADAVSVGRLSLGQKLLGHPVVMTVNGRIERAAAGGGQRIVLAGNRTDGKAGTVDLSYEQGGDPPIFRAHVDDAEILPSWLGLDSCVALDLAGSGPRKDWRGTLSATASSQIILEGKLQFFGEFPTVITASLDANISPSRRLQALERFLGPDAHLSFEALLRKSGELDVLDVAAASPRGTILGAGTALLPEREFDLSFQGSHADLSLLSCREEGTGPYLPANITASVKGNSSKIDIMLAAMSRSVQLFNAETTVLPGSRVQIDGAAELYTGAFSDSDAAKAVFGESGAMAWSGQYTAPGHLTLAAFAVDNQAVQVNASGTLEFPSTSAEIDYSGVVHGERIRLLAQYLKSDYNIPFTGKISDRLTEPVVSFAAKNINAAANGLALEDGTLNIGFHLDQSERKRSLRNGIVRVESPHCSYRDGLGLALSCNASFESDDFDSFQFHGIDLAMPSIGGRLAADMDYARTTGKAAVEGRVRLDDLASTSALYPHPLGGVLSGAFHMKKDTQAGPLRLKAECDLKHPSGLPEALVQVAGEKVHASLRLESGGDRITIQDADFAAENGSVTAHGWYDKRDRGFDLLLDSKAKDLGKVLTGKLLERSHGVVAVSSHLHGAMDDFALSGDAHLNDLSWDRVVVRSTKLKFKAEHLPASPEGTASVSASNGKKGPAMEGSLAFHFGEGRFHVEKAKFSLSKNRLEGDLDYRTDSREFSANASFAFPALKDLSALLSVDLAGTAQGKVTASRKGESLDVTLQGKAEKLETPWGAIGSLDANGSVTDILRGPQGKGKIIVADYSRNSLQVGRADLTLSGDGSSASVKATMAGHYQKSGASEPLPFQVKTSANASFQNQSLTIAEAAGQVANINFDLSVPAHMRHSGTDYTLDNAVFHVGGGGGEVSVGTSGTGIHAATSWKDIPLSVAMLAGLDGIDGTSSGSFVVEGPLKAPACRLEMMLTKVRKTDLDQGPGVDASIKAVHDGQWASTEITATLSDAAKATISARVPLNLSLSPAGVVVRDRDALQADADVSADLAASAVLMDWINDLPQGTVTGKFHLGGTVDAPLVSGELNLKNGGYENLKYGAVLKNLQARLVADGNTVSIADFNGTDGGEGKLSATGQMEVSFAKRHPFRADVTLEQMRSFRTEYGTAVLSGKLQCAGSMADAALHGGITVQEGEFRLADRMSPAKTAKVEFTDKNKPAQPAVSKAAPTPALPAIALDVSISVPGRMFVRAPVLETEWNGDMHLRGTLKEPRVEGDLRVNRGYLDLIGQRFALADSTVGFTRGDIRAPYLNMTGVCSTTDITARIQVSGPPADAQLTLSSDPPLPQDEILSKLLFRKGVSQASPLQAIQIARSAAMFSDRLSLPQFLTGNVKLPGVDLFDIRTGEKVDKTVVGVGKYINDKIYVEAEQGAATDSGRVSAQVEVTPRVSVKADVGARNRGGVGIMWKKDY